MMKTTNIFFIYMLAAALVGCSSEDEVTDNAPVAVRVNGEIVGTGTTRATGTSWDNGDAIGVSVASTGKTSGTNVKYSYNGREFVTLEPIYFSDMETVTFNAYYPFSGTSGTAETTIVASTSDQTKQKDFDFLFASGATASITAPEVSFTGDHCFRHCMSQLTFSFVAGDGIEDLSKLTSYKVEGLVMEGTFNTSDGVAAASNADAANLTTELTGLASGTSYTAAPLVLFPQLPADRKFNVTIVYDGITYRGELSIPSSQGLTAGNCYAYNIIINKTSINVSKAQIIQWTSVNGSEIYPIYKDPARGIVEPEQEVDLDLTIVKEEKIYKVIFAKSNLTATGLAANETDFGDYFAWAATEPWLTSYKRSGNSLSDFTWKAGKSAGYTEANAPYYDGTSYVKYTYGETLEMEDDAARQILGGDWQLPTLEIWSALVENTANTWISGDTNGIQFTANGQTLFLPAAGRMIGKDYWDCGDYGYYSSSTGEPDISMNCLIFSEFEMSPLVSTYRYYGLVVRPVRLVEL
ncbi:MAG: fimbrillin family protein [Prevotella sp.]